MYTIEDEHFSVAECLLYLHRLSEQNENDIQALKNYMGEGTTLDLIVKLQHSTLPHHLNYIKHLVTLPVRDGEGTPFTQGFAINQDANEIYTSRQLNGGGSVEIHKFDLTTGQHLAQKAYIKTTGAYQEGLPYFYNEQGHLCFLVRPTYNGTLAIFNFDTGELGEPMEVEGGSKVTIDDRGEIFATGRGDATRFEGITFYDFKELQQGNPVIIKHLQLPQSVINDEKVQGFTICNGNIYLSHGGSGGYPVITCLTLNGEVISRVEFEKLDLYAKTHDGSLNMNGKYENEGMSIISIGERPYPVSAQIFGEDLCLVIHGQVLEGEEVKQVANVPINTRLEWKPLPLAEGIESYHEDVAPYYAKDANGMVYLRGVVKHTPKVPESDESLLLATLGYPYRANQNCFYLTNASGYADKINRIQVSKNGQILLIDTTSESPEPFTVLDGISFYCEEW